MRRPLSLAALVVASLATATACGSGQSAPRGTEEDSPPTTTVVNTQARSAPRPDVVRDCDPQQTGVGYGGVSKQAFRASLRVGPIALGSLRVLKRSQLPPARADQRRFYPIESIAVVDAGANVTVAIAPADRRHAAMIYDQSKFRSDGLYRIADLDDVVRFEACDDPEFNNGYSQFDGGFVVAQRRCFSIDIWVDGRRSRRSAIADCKQAR